MGPGVHGGEERKAETAGQDDMELWEDDGWVASPCPPVTGEEFFDSFLTGGGRGGGGRGGGGGAGGDCIFEYPSGSQAGQRCAPPPVPPGLFGGGSEKVKEEGEGDWDDWETDFSGAHVVGHLLL